MYQQMQTYYLHVVPKSFDIKGMPAWGNARLVGLGEWKLELN